jgi:hypothetical protein
MKNSVIEKMTRDELLVQKQMIENQLKELNTSKPVANHIINWETVLNTANAYIEDLQNGAGVDEEDIQQYLFEEVMEAIYGDNIFDWIYKRL